jgi:hypothetical protein
MLFTQDDGCPQRDFEGFAATSQDVLEVRNGGPKAPYAGVENSTMTNWERRIGSAPQRRLAGSPNPPADLGKRDGSPKAAVDEGLLLGR